MPSSAPVCKFISCRFSCSAGDLVYHQYGICRMYSEENPKDFSLPVPGLYSCEWVVLLLSTEASFKPGSSLLWKFTSENLSQGFILCRPSLAYKGSGYTIFCTEPSICIIGIYGISSRTSNPDIHEFLLHTDTVLQSYSLIEWLEREVFDKRYTVYLYVVNLCTEFNRLCFLASYDRTYVMTVDADDAVLTFLPSNSSFSCTRTFLIMERRFW